MLGKGYWIYIFWLTSIVVVGAGGVLLGGVKTPPPFLASIGEAFSNVFGRDDGGFAEVLDVGEYQKEEKKESVRMINTPVRSELILVDQVVTKVSECALDLGIDPIV